MLDMKDGTVRQRLYQMSKAGEVKVVSRGLYVPHTIHNDRNDEDDVMDGMDVMDAPKHGDDEMPF